MTLQKRYSFIYYLFVSISKIASISTVISSGGWFVATAVRA
ncbi:hypothetical protein CLK_1492 [Clostridium botulinum A3 str. Loch Maree]|nr:hypothetical protein CLK_1492 [Clostridium botulinum A3 str. Loch Maree]